MKKNSNLSIALTLLLLGLVLSFGCAGTKRADSVALDGDRGAAADRTAKAESPSASTKVADADSKPAAPLSYRLTETKSDFNHAADAERRTRWPVQMYASGGRGKIVDNNGNIIDQSDKTKFIFGCTVSPDRKNILIYRGNVDYDLLNLESKKVTRLPSRPPGENVLGFNSWDWVKDDLLLGSSYKVADSPDNGEEPTLERSVLYTYRLSEQELRRVDLSSIGEESVVHVRLVDELGNVALQSEKITISPKTGNLTWFKLQPND